MKVKKYEVCFEGGVAEFEGVHLTVDCDKDFTWIVDSEEDDGGTYCSATLFIISNSELRCIKAIAVEHNAGIVEVEGSNE